jgi:creatinine amidohydrolase
MTTLTRGPQADRSIFAGTMVDLPWPEVERAAKAGEPVLVPVGIVEAHGPHMDLSPDIYLSVLGCRFLRQRLAAKGVDSIIAPPVYWGISEDVKRYPGTFSVRPETFGALLGDVFASLDSWGFRHAFVFNAHGDPTHRQVIDRSVQDARARLRLRVYELGELELAPADAPELPPPRPGRYEPDYHAGAGETAAMHLYFPERVNAPLARTLAPQPTFHPLAYCGDPASFERERDLIAFLEADTEADARKIEAVLRGRLPA